MPKTKVEVYDKDQLIYPYIESDHVSFSNGMKVSEMLDQSISMPTVTHEDLSFKVGVGDSDVSSSIVDSSVSKMVIKGQTYQNILPEPSTHVLSNNKEMFKVNEGLDPNVEIVDGVSKSAILKGQTLVNLNASEGAKTSSTNVCDFTMVYLKPNTTYTIIFEVSYSGTESNGTLGFLTTDKADWNVNTSYDGNGSYKKLLTTKSNIDLGVTLRFRRNNVDGDFTISNVIVLEGDYTNKDIPYFEGMQSVKMPVVHTIGKNLLSGYINGGMNANTGEDVSASDKIRTSFIAIDNAKSYYLSNIPSQSWNYVAYYDSNKQFIGRTGAGAYTSRSLCSSNGQVGNSGYRGDIFPCNAKYIKLTSYQNVNTGDVTAEELLEMSKSTQLEEGSAATSYEPFKSNILHAPEEVVLRLLPNGIKDTLNLNTGEYVQRIGEITFKNQTAWEVAGGYPNLYYYNTNDIGNANIYVGSGAIPNLYCDKIAVTSYSGLQQSTSGVKISNRGKEGTHSIAVYNSDITNNVVDFKAWLTQNPFTVQYELATPIIKTVDLSTSGNWEKVVLDGSEDWRGETIKNGMRLAYILPRTQQLAGGGIFSDKLKSTTQGDEVGIRNSRNNGIYLQISDDGTTIKQWVTANAPLTVWYQTITTQDSTQVKQPIFFKDGHIIQSSGVDNSLIPTLDYQAKTSNSYVMDLMKTNTKYTMKAKTASGTFTIDGTSYGAGTNGTFTTPSSMTNKFLVMSNKTNEEVMLIEGDAVSKTIPYFKGIKSAFEDESKIEVLSTGKNITHIIVGGDLGSQEYNFMNILEQYKNTSAALNRAKVIKWVGDDKFFVKGYGINQYDNQYNIDFNPSVLKPNTTYYISFESIEGSHETNPSLKLGLDSFNVWLNGTRVLRVYSGGTYSFTTPSQINSFGFNIWLSGTKDKNATIYAIFNKFMIEEGESYNKKYEPYKSNNTKIPLLSPLRSLPNGVCDEVILDRENNKAKVIQRVGELDFSNLQYNTWIVSDSTLSKTVRFTWLSSNISFYKVKDSSDGICDSIPYIRYNSSDTEHCRFDGSNPSAFMIWVDKSKLTSFDDKGLKKYLSTLPSTRVQYELATPVITEVDLEGFPYIYKDGHIFLNGEIVSVTEITYSINQCQQISASNEDIIRHEKELTYLQKLIAQYVKVDYESALLSLKV